MIAAEHTAGAATGNSGETTNTHGTAPEVGVTLSHGKINFACAHAAGNLRPLFVAMRDHGLGILMIDHRGGFEMLHRGDLTGTIALVGDDLPGGGTAGPIGFNQEMIARLLNSESAAVFVYSAAANAGHYQSFAAMALAGGIVTIIETQPDREEAWLRFISRVSPGTAAFVVTSRSMAEHAGKEARA
jgi:hypothetical protein